MTPGKKGALVLTVRLGQHIDMGNGLVMYVSKIRGKQVGIVFIADRKLDIKRTEKYGSTDCTREEYNQLRYAREREVPHETPRESSPRGAVILRKKSETI